MGLDGFEIRHVFVEDCGPVSPTAELNVAFDHILQLPLQLN
jgi:hypothetical protein